MLLTTKSRKPAGLLLMGCLLMLTGIRAQEKMSGGDRENIIFDSDMGPDYDDVGAITILHAFADEGRINILATIASTRYANVAAVFNVFNTYFHRSEIPIAVPRLHGLLLRDGQYWSDTLVANYPHRIHNNAETPEPVALYRKILSSEPDKSVTLITVGFLTNLADLLQSPPDQYSKLTGCELVKRKVKKLVSMAGRFPAGKEFNIAEDAASSVYTFNHWPTEIWFSGFEIGEKIKTGLPLIENKSIQYSPVKDVFRICIPLSADDSAGRKSWDETAVLIAVRGYSDFYSRKPGRIKVGADGTNSWDPSGHGYFYLLEKEKPEKVGQILNNLMQHQPQ